MSHFSNRDGLIVALNLVNVIRDNREYLSEIDGAIGDGDHGVNMSKGFTLAGERLAAGEMNLTEAFKTLGRTLLGDIGGSMGPLYGTFFLKMSRTLGASEQIDAALFGSMLESALAGIKELGGAQVGDKTLVDTLEPAQTAFACAVEEGRDFTAALAAMQAAAETGWQSTKNLVAKIGRASRLGERSRGTLDAGATSCWLLLNSMAESIGALLGSEHT